MVTGAPLVLSERVGYGDGPIPGNTPALAIYTMGTGGRRRNWNNWVQHIFHDPILIVKNRK